MHAGHISYTAMTNIQYFYLKFDKEVEKYLYAVLEYMTLLLLLLLLLLFTG
jgi:hypothetical protein